MKSIKQKLNFCCLNIHLFSERQPDLTKLYTLLFPISFIPLFEQIHETSLYGNIALTTCFSRKMNESATCVCTNEWFDTDSARLNSFVAGFELTTYAYSKAVSIDREESTVTEVMSLLNFAY